MANLMVYPVCVCVWLFITCWCNVVVMKAAAVVVQVYRFSLPPSNVNRSLPSLFCRRFVCPCHNSQSLLIAAIGVCFFCCHSLR